MSLKKIFANTLYFGLIPKITVLANLVILPLITPYLTTFDYGVQGVLQSYTGLIAMVAPLGLHVHLSNSYYEIPRNFQLVWGRVLFIFLLSGVIFGFVNIAILLKILPFTFSWEIVLLSIFGSFQIFFFGNSLMASNLFMLEGTPKPLVWTNLFSSLIGIVVSFVLIYYFRLGYWGLVSATSIATLLSFLLFIKYVWKDFHIRPILDRNIRRIKHMLVIGLPLVPHSMGFVLLSSSARIVMSIHHVEYDDIGLYSHGYTMGDQIVAITTALVIAITPQLQVTYRSKNFKEYRRLFIFCQAFAIFSTFLFCLWMPEVYSLLIRNEQLSTSITIASLTCFANVVYPFYVFMSSSAFIEKKTMYVLWLVFIPGFLNLILCYILIPLFGYRAAVYSTLASYWSQIFIPFIIPYFRTKVKMWINNLGYLFVFFGILFTSVIVANVLMTYGIIIRALVTIIFSTLFILIVIKPQKTLSYVRKN